LALALRPAPGDGKAGLSEPSLPSSPDSSIYPKSCASAKREIVEISGISGISARDPVFHLVDHLAGHGAV
jgi:hypothetical protein